MQYCVRSKTYNSRVFSVIFRRFRRVTGRKFELQIYKKKRSLCGRLKFVWLRTANVGRISQSTAGRSLFCKLVDEDFGCVKARFMPTLLKFTIFWLKPPKFSLSEWTTQSTSFFSNTYSHLLLPKIFWDKCDISSKETQSESSFLAEYQLLTL